MRVEYDAESGGTYIYLVEADERGPGGYSLPLREVGEGIVLDFNGADELVGIEVLFGPRHLPDVLLSRAERI